MTKNSKHKKGVSVPAGQSPQDESRISLSYLPFDKAAAEHGARLFTRDGHPVTVLSFHGVDPDYPIVALVDFGCGVTIPNFFSDNGKHPGCSELDLFISDLHYEYSSRRNTGQATTKTQSADRKSVYRGFIQRDGASSLSASDILSAVCVGQQAVSLSGTWWRRFYAGLFLQGLVASDKWRRMEMGDRVSVCIDMADALLEELERHPIK